MAYIGNQSATAFTSFDKQVITGNGGTTYTLSHAVANEQEIEVFVNNVRQEGGAGKAFTVSGNQITFTGAVASSDSCYVNFQGKAIQTVVPPDGSVSTAKLADGSVTATKLASGVQGVAGITTASTSGTAMSIDSSNRITTPARPSFGARGYVGAVTGQGYSSTSYFGVIDHNIGSHFENSSTTGAKFTAPVAGVYHFIHFMGLRAAHNNFMSIHLDKNGAVYLDAWDTSTHGTVHGHITVSAYMQLAVGDIVRAGWYTSYNAPSTGTNYGGFSGCFMG